MAVAEMRLWSETRDGGMEFAVGWFLLALAGGLIINLQVIGHSIKPGLATLYSSIYTTGYIHVWICGIIGSAAWLIASSFHPSPWVRLVGVLVGMVCWAALATKFVQVSLWGAMLQSMAGIIILNSCMWRLIRHIRDR